MMVNKSIKTTDGERTISTDHAGKTDHNMQNNRIGLIVNA